MDNFRIDITSEKKEAFVAALRLCKWNKVTGYSVHPEFVDDELRSPYKPARMLLYWGDTSKTPVTFPYEMSIDQAAEFAWGWLQEAQRRGSELDHDGSNGEEGWRIYNEAWGFVDDDHYAFVAIEPHWAWYGK